MTEKDKERYERWLEKNKDHYKEYQRQYYLRNRDKLRARAKEYAENNKDVVLEKHHTYYTTNKEVILEKQREYYQTHRTQRSQRSTKYYTKNREKILKKTKEYKSTLIGRAGSLRYQYLKQDRKYHRGECTLTTKWIVENILTKHCLYCGESDWHLLGCDRINNNKPHMPGNVVCCCYECNIKRGKADFLEYAYSIGAKDSEGLVIVYP